MASSDDILEIEYDERGDVLYASIGAPQAALTYEAAEDILLRYTPPSHEVIGITILNFLHHYPVEDRESRLERAKTIVSDLLRKHPYVPLLPEQENDLWFHISISTSDDISLDQRTEYPSRFPGFESPSIQWTQATVEDRGP